MDIFISYKRKSLVFANNLYYRLTQRGYSVFFDLEELRRDRFDVQLLSNIEEAKDFFVVLEEGSLDGCQKENWEDRDWFCKEIAHALEKRKNIIPILLDGFKMPPADFFPEKLKELEKKQAPPFDIAFFPQYLNNLEEKGFLLSKPDSAEKGKSVFKLYSNKDSDVFLDGKLVGRLTGEAKVPFYLPVPRKGTYRFMGVDIKTGKEKVIKSRIDENAEDEVEFTWETAPDPISTEPEPADDREFRDPSESQEEAEDDEPVRIIKLDGIQFRMIRVEGGLLGTDYVDAFYIGQFPITQNIWKHVMGENPSTHKEKELAGIMKGKWGSITKSALLGTVLGPIGTLGGGLIGFLSGKGKDDSEGHLPVETVNYFDAIDFVRRLSEMTGLSFNLPTEKEWEYAASGGKFSHGFKFAGSDHIDEVAWYRENSKETTHPVGEKAPNELGLFDMCGNVWEWTFAPKSASEAVRKGGSWWHPEPHCEITNRYFSRRNKKTSGLGLRVVLHID